MLGVVSVIAFRLILIATMFQATKTFPGFFQKYARVMATGVAAFINAIIIEVGYLISVPRNNFELAPDNLNSCAWFNSNVGAVAATCLAEGLGRIIL